jgi:hypothetical protein
MTTQVQNEAIQGDSVPFRQWVVSDGWQHSRQVAFGVAYYRCGTMVKARRLCFDHKSAWFERDAVREESIELLTISTGPTAMLSTDGVTTVTIVDEGLLFRANDVNDKLELPVYFHRSGLRADFRQDKEFRRQDDGILLPHEVAKELRQLIKPKLRPKWLSVAATRYRIARSARQILTQSAVNNCALVEAAPKVTLLTAVDTGLNDSFFTELSIARGYRFASEFESCLRAGATQQELMLMLLRNK